MAKYRINKKANTINGKKIEFGNLEQIKILQEIQREKEAKQEFEKLSVFEKAEHIGVWLEMNSAMLADIYQKLDTADLKELRKYKKEVKRILKQNISYYKILGDELGIESAQNTIMLIENHGKEN